MEESGNFLNLTFEFLQEFSDIIGHFSIITPKHSNSKTFDNVVLKTSVNICKVLKGIVANFFAKALFNDMKKYVGKTEISCPIKKVNKKFSVDY